MPKTTFRRLSGAGPVGSDGVAELAEEAKRRERQTNWVNKRDAKLAKLRLERKDQLSTEGASRSDRMAATAWSWLTGAGAVRPIPGEITILNKYVARTPAAAETSFEEFRLGGRPTAPPPPMSRLAAGAGRSLPLHLAMMGVAQLIVTDGGKMTNAPERDRGRIASSSKPTAKGGLRIVTLERDEADWAKLIGIPGVGKARTVRVHEPLRRLRAFGLISYPDGQPSRFTLLSEDGTGRRWTRPELDPLDPSFGVPFDFWRNRWYLWLTPAEVATLFAVYHAWHVAPARVVDEGLGLPESIRRTVYDMSGERYSTIHELIEFGLIEMVSPSLRPKRGQTAAQSDQPGLTHHIRPVPPGLAVDARQTILDRLEASPLPPRLSLLPEARASYAAELRAATQDPA